MLCVFCLVPEPSPLIEPAMAADSVAIVQREAATDPSAVQTGWGVVICRAQRAAAIAIHSAAAPAALTGPAREAVQAAA